VLADDDAVLQVCLGEGGLVDALSPAAVLANVSTVSPDVVHRLAERLPADRFLDAPVMGSPANVADGHCRFLLGGDRDTVSATGPLWDDLGAGSTYCGPVGNATTMKLVSNLLLIAGVAAMAEGIATARGLDIPDPLIREILSHSPVVSPASGVRLDSVMDGSHPGWFTPALARKDVRHAVALAEQAGLQVRIGPATEALLTDVIDGAEGGAAEWPDFSAVIEAI
jgi:3-hydroxyisobutyrate dehydrogenase